MLKIRPMQRHRPRRRPPEPCAISAATTKPLMRGCALAGARRGAKRKPREQKAMACGPFAGTLPGMLSHDSVDKTSLFDSQASLQCEHHNATSITLWCAETMMACIVPAHHNKA